MKASEFTLTAQIACVNREIRWRRYVYPKRVASSKMTLAEAEKEIAGMEAILVTLTNLLIEENKRGETPSLFDRAAIARAKGA